MQWGDKVTYFCKYYRATADVHRVWRHTPPQKEGKVGIFLGYRTLVGKGRVVWGDYDTSTYLIPSEYLKVALVSPGPRGNAIYVPIDRMEKFDV
jgi:hypothetical protein